MRYTALFVVALTMVLALSTACAQGNLPQPVQAAVADLAGQLEIGQNEVTVASFEEVTWPDASLGVPEPGRVYAQVLTPGYRVFLTAQGQRYQYHTDRQAQVKLVDSEQIGDTGDGQMTPQQQVQQQLAVLRAAKQQLAGRLGIDQSDVYIGAVEERTWPSAALGLPGPDERYAQVMTPGYRVVLEARGVLYDYHLDMTGQAKPAGIVEPAADNAGGEGNAGGDQANYPPSVAAAISDLAERLSMDTNGVAVVDVEQRTWPDSAMGLPEPGMMYMQAIVSGHRIVLQANGRQFAYHAGERDFARYAGIVYPEGGEASILAMSRTEPADGNNFFHLVRIDPESLMRETAVEFVANFVATPDGRDLLVKRRTSRSSHMLLHVTADGTETELASAFDFRGMALRPDGQMAAYWSRPTVTDANTYLSIRVQPWREDLPIQPDLPGVPAEFSPGELVFTDSGLAFTLRDNTGARSFYWTPEDGVREMGRFAVLAWVPRTRTLLVRRAQNNREILATWVPGSGQTAVLADVPDLQSADAPVDTRWVMAAVSEGGTPQVQQISWGGNVNMGVDLEGAQSARVRVLPTGTMAVAEYMQGDTNRTDVLSLQDGGQTQTITDAAGAVPVVE